MDFIKQVASGDWVGAEANLRNFGDPMFVKRRTREADLLPAEKKTQRNFDLNSVLDNADIDIQEADEAVTSDQAAIGINEEDDNYEDLTKYEYGNLNQEPTVTKEQIVNQAKLGINEGDANYENLTKYEYNKLAKDQYKPLDPSLPQGLFGQDSEQFGKLFLDDAYNFSKAREFVKSQHAYSDIFWDSVKDNTVIGSMIDAVTVPTWIQGQEPNGTVWTINKHKAEFVDLIKRFDLDEAHIPSLSGAMSYEHLLYLAEQARIWQDKKELIASRGWTGTAMELLPMFLDPVSYMYYGRVGSIASKIMQSPTSRTRALLKTGAVYGIATGTEIGGLFASDPTKGFNDVIIAAAFGGTLGAGVSAYVARSLQKVAKATTIIDATESGLKINPKGSLKDTPVHSLETKEFQDIRFETFVDEALSPEMLAQAEAKG